MAELRLFGYRDVEAKGARPWTTQQKFSEELDTESMSDTAAAYARAAAEARNVDALAGRATRISRDAGNLNGAPLVNPDGRFNETHRGLQRGGRDVDSVVRHIIRGMNHAIDAEKYAHGWVYWTNDKLEHFRDQARKEWAAWDAALRTAVASHRAAGPPSVPGPDGEVVVAVSDGGGAWTLPQRVPDAIREKYLAKAVEKARDSETKIKDAIEHYRHKLMGEAAELAELGYELSESPFKLVMTPDMARYAASALKEALGKEHPDRHLLERYTAVLRSIAEGVYEDPTRPSRNPRNLTGEELEYLKRFFHGIDAKSLATLGNIPMGGDPLRVGNPVNVKQSVANGIMMLLNEDIGGLGPRGTRPVDPNEVPASIQHFIDGPPRGLGRNALIEFNGFGGLMGEATVATDLASSKSLARAALEYEKSAGAGIGLTHSERSSMINRGSSGVLEAVAQNSVASAELLNEREFRRDLMTQGWDVSDGAGALITSGTTIPSGVDPSDPEARRHVEAGRNVLQTAARMKEQVLQTGLPLGGAESSLNGGVRGRDLDAMHRAIGATAVNYMDMVSTSTPGDTRLLPPRGDDPWRFQLSMEERSALFEMMNSTSGPVKEEFFGDVAGWQYDTALKNFQESRMNTNSSDFTRIGSIQATVAETQRESESPSTTWSSVKKLSDLAGLLPYGSVPSTIVGMEADTQIEKNAAEVDEKNRVAARRSVTESQMEGKIAIALAGIRAGTLNGGRVPPDLDPGRSGYNLPEAYEAAEDILGEHAPVARQSFDSGYRPAPS
ncbi:TPR repeat region-containing protein [Streptomyces triticirhizae]|uniref:TPR repeat domain-containing protein n=1 Tax=Streptomyces triticirhizae TaxID=2483353 RepID=A0A3M2KW25_9ACTN|nr:hypothetical protein [Streptomyces triticirhizae]RMI29787.1 hypothetical protein EBN88_27145 [Streptomyces triticirhizae]